MKPEPETLLKVIIADDHKFFRDGFQLSLKRISSISKVTHARNGKEVLAVLKQEKHNVIFMDVKMPEMNGIEATKKVKYLFPDVKVIALSMFDDQRNVIEMFNSGASGYIIKNTDKKEIEKALTEIMAGKSYFSPAVTDVLLQKLIEKQKENYSPLKSNLLTEREVQILQLICKEMSNREIAAKLFISEKTVEGHRSELFEKCKVKNVAGLVLFAVKNGYHTDI